MNLDKVMYPATGYTKAEVISYYSQIAEVLLPYIADRALTRVRFPDGVAGPSFYEKNAPAGTPGWVRTARILTSDGPVDVRGRRRAGHRGVAGQPGRPGAARPAVAVGSALPDPTAAEAGAWSAGSRWPIGWWSTSIPGAGMTIVEVARAALIAAERLAADGLVPVPQTSGSKGIQVYAAVAPMPEPADVWAYVKQLNATPGTDASRTSSSPRCRSRSGRAGSTSTTTRTWRPATPSRRTRCVAASDRAWRRR